MTKTRALIALAAVLGYWLLIALSCAKAQEHQHPPSDVQLHKEFYSKWKIPPSRRVSCCNDKDCYPTPIKFMDGRYWAQRREDFQWMEIPWNVLEQNQDEDENQHHSPDQLSHACMPPPEADHPYVFCATLGAGL